MLNKINKVFYIFCVAYVSFDVLGMILKHYDLTTRDETCRNQVMEKYYEKHGSLENFSKHSAMSNYVLMHGSLEGFKWRYDINKRAK